MVRQTAVEHNFAEEHVRLDGLFEDVLNRARAGDWGECDKIWRVFSAALEAHFRFEEEQLFPGYAASSAEAKQDVATLRAEHEGVRRMLDLIGVELELKRVDEAAIVTLIALLRAHASRENNAFHPWVQAGR